MERIIIRHLSGSKANQEESFSLDEFQKTSIGRDASSDIAYDPTIDDLVSRQHAQIEQNPEDKSQFKLTDLNSSNGVSVNKVKVHGSSMITHGDIIQLGKNGPEFVFELDPPPAKSIKATRLSEVPVKLPPKTRENVIEPFPVPNSVSAITPDNTSGSGPRPIGRETVERLITGNKKESRKFFINTAAAILGIVALIAAILVYKNIQMGHNIDTTKQQISQTQTILEKTDTKVGLMDALKSPREIADAYSSATIFIEVSWKLIDTVSGMQLYHRMMDGKPAYIQLSNQTIEPWLITDNEKNTNVPIGGIHTGSGFVVTENGFILTNRHVAAPWLTQDRRPLPGILYGVTADGNLKELGVIENYAGDLDKWVPAKSTLLGGKTVGAKRIEGRHDTLDVTFPKNKLRIPAKLVRISNEHDVSLMKIDIPQAVKKVELYDNYDSIKAGDPITVLGYPGISPGVYVTTKSQDPFNPVSDVVQVPDPTVTPGIIGKVIRGVARPVGGELYNYYSEMDSYQLTATATGGGNSGGPVFNEYGKVIGIFYADKTERNARITFAVPIKFGMDLMLVSPVLK